MQVNRSVVVPESEAVLQKPSVPSITQGGEIIPAMSTHVDCAAAQERSAYLRVGMKLTSTFVN